MKKVEKKYPNQIKKFRNKKKWLVKDVATLLGISTKVAKDLEEGTIVPTPDQILKLTIMFDDQEAELFAATIKKLGAKLKKETAAKKAPKKKAN